MFNLYVYRFDTPNNVLINQHVEVRLCSRPIVRKSARSAVQRLFDICLDFAYRLVPNDGVNA